MTYSLYNKPIKTNLVCHILKLNKDLLYIKVHTMCTDCLFEIIENYKMCKY